MDLKSDDNGSSLDIAALMPQIPGMNLKPEAVELILGVIKQHLAQIATTQTLLKQANTRLSYFLSYNPGVGVSIKTPNIEGSIDIYFGSGTANIDVFDLSQEEIQRYTWHGVIEDLPQFLSVLRETFGVLFSEILQDDEGHN